MKTDSLFYKIFSLWPELVFRLAGISHSAQNYRFSSEELKQTAQRVDGIFKPPEDKTDAPIVFLEVQIQRDDQLYARLFTEIFMYLRQYDPENPWQAVVIYPSKTQESEHHQHHYKALLDSENVHIIYLRELLKTLPDLPGLGFLKLIMASPKQAKKQAELLLQQRHQRSENYGISLQNYVEWIETILVYKFPQMTREDVRTMLELQNIDLRETQFYKDVFAEGEQQEQEKQRQREIALAKRLLIRRFSTLPVTMEKHLSTLSIMRAEALVEALFDFNSIDDVKAWLYKQPESKG